MESRPHHALDVTLGEDHSRVRQPNAAFGLSRFRRVVVSLAQVWVDAGRTRPPNRRATPRQFQQRCAHRDGGPARLQALIGSNSPVAWRLPL
jgi:hypothetical protein